MSTWWEHFHSGLEPWVLTARDPRDGRLVGLAPWVHRKLPLGIRGFYREISFLGGGPGSADHLDIIARGGLADPVASVFLARMNEERWHVLRFEGISAASPIVRSLLRREASRWNHVSTLVCAFAPLPATWEDFEEGLARRLRYNLRSRARRLERDRRARVVYRTVTREEEIPEALSILSSFRRNVRRHGRDGFAGAAKRSFHEHVASRFFRRGWLRFHLLEVGGQVIAASYCFRYRDTVYFYQTGYDRECSAYGPGASITAHSIREAVRDKAREFDFLRGDHAYKFQFTQQARHGYKVRLPAAVLGRLVVSGYRLVRGERAGLRNWLGHGGQGRPLTFLTAGRNAGIRQSLFVKRWKGSRR